MDLVLIAASAGALGLAPLFGGQGRRDPTAAAVGLFLLGISAAFALLLLGISIDD